MTFSKSGFSATAPPHWRNKHVESRGVHMSPMCMCWFEPRPADLIAPEVVFLGLFCKTLGARLVRTLRGDVNALVFACQRVPGVAPRSHGPRSAKTCFLPVTRGISSTLAACCGLLARLLRCRAVGVPWARIFAGKHMRVQRSPGRRVFCLFFEHIKKPCFRAHAHLSGAVWSSCYRERWRQAIRQVLHPCAGRGNND
jgi:hypothetical protein